MPEHLNGAREEQELPALERELAQLLAVEPSPEFAARVRSRIAAEPARSRRWWWVLAPASVAAATFIVFAISGTPDVQVPGSTPADIRLRTEVRGDQPPPMSTQRAAVAPSKHTMRRRAVSERAAQPEIVIDPSLAAAIRRLASERPALPEVPPEPSLDPVVVEPLKVPEIGELGGAGL